MNALLHEDIVWCLRRLPRSVFKLIKEAGPELVLAGGFIRSVVAHEKPSDIDLFSTTKEKAELHARRYAENRGRIISTENAYTVVERGKMSVQFIHRWVYTQPEDILKSFDFTIAMAAIWFDGFNWKSQCDPRFYPDLAAKRLTYTSPKREEEAGGSMLRVLKFYQRGYRIPLDSLGYVLARLCKAVDFNTTRADEHQIGMVLSGLLRMVDPLIDPTHEAHMPASDDTDPENPEQLPPAEVETL